MIAKEEIKKGVIITLIATFVITCVIQPLFKFLSPIFMSLSAKFITRLSDSIYRHAALGQNYFIDTIPLMVIVGVVGALTTVEYMFYFRRKHNFINKLLGSTNREESNKKILIISMASFLLVSYLAFDLNLNVILNTSFNQKVSIMSPYMTDLEVKHLRSKWASMKHGSDYQIICDIIDRCAKKNDINLPHTLQ